MLLSNLSTRSDFGLVIDWKFHLKRKWVSAYTPYLVDAIVAAFNPVIITSQLSYALHRKRLKYILSFEPGIAAPKIKYGSNGGCRKGVIYSDPHYQPVERMRYFEDNGFDHVFSLYKTPFFRHFTGFPEEKFIHWPWAVPDQFISSHPVEVRSNEVAIFGGSKSDAYDVRNWCREQPGVTSFEFSGVENKQLADDEFYRWLARFDAIVAAGSSSPEFNLVTPKYFEIAAAGALLLGQYCDDLADLGFNESNYLGFRKEDFREKLEAYRRCPQDYLETRRRGRELIRERHKLSDRIQALREVFYGG